MNGDNRTPNQGTSNLHNNRIIFRFFLKTNQQLAEAVELRMATLNHPAVGLETRIAFNFRPFFLTRTDVRDISVLQNEAIPLRRSASFVKPKA